ncbi:MAG TPA: SRPBCC domain-containing protein [Stellaceae bacterium]|nr:SRPBCC domain-containing protein [Stellaceae bacterium]
MPDIEHLIKIHVSTERVHQALTTAGGICNGWTRHADLDSKIGGTGEFRFYESQRANKVRVEERKPPVHVVWKTISSFRPKWDGTTITFALRAEGSDTVLSFAHRGFVQGDEVYG